jgi:hypothetical protein
VVGSILTKSRAGQSCAAPVIPSTREARIALFISARTFGGALTITALCLLLGGPALGAEDEPVADPVLAMRPSADDPPTGTLIRITRDYRSWGR